MFVGPKMLAVEPFGVEEAHLISFLWVCMVLDTPEEKFVDGQDKDSVVRRDYELRHGSRSSFFLRLIRCRGSGEYKSVKVLMGL